jgi:hypothetical protein
MMAMRRLLRCKIEGEQVDAIRGLGRGGEEGEEGEAGGAGSSREEHMHILQFDFDCLALQRRRRHRAAPGDSYAIGEISEPQNISGSLEPFRNHHCS